MTLLDNEDRKAAIQQAIEDGAIPTDEPIYAVYVDHYCPECQGSTKAVEQACAWSHIGSAMTRPQTIECWTCGSEILQTKVWFSEWDAPLDRLPPSAIPDEYHEIE